MYIDETSALGFLCTEQFHILVFSSYERCSSPFFILVALHWTLSSSSVSCTGEHRPGHNTPDV